MTGYNWPEVNELIEKFREIERARIIAIIEQGNWSGENLDQDINNLITLIKDEQ